MSDPKNEKQTRQRAVALRYEEDDKAPKIIATGAGEIARRILELAKQHDVPIKQDDSLVDILGKLDVDLEIPPETYNAVAEILAFLYRTDEKWRKRVEGKSTETSVSNDAQNTVDSDKLELDSFLEVLSEKAAKEPFK